VNPESAKNGTMSRPMSGACAPAAARAGASREGPAPAAGSAGARSSEACALSARRRGGAPRHDERGDAEIEKTGQQRGLPESEGRDEDEPGGQDPPTAPAVLSA
jgi:hypothetical protein